jgi:hypothetical protein
MRLSLRQASGTSRMIADILGDDRYFISPSSLCDYELLNTAPRHFQTVITLCSLYGLVTADAFESNRDWSGRSWQRADARSFRFQIPARGVRRKTGSGVGGWRNIRRSLSASTLIVVSHRLTTFSIFARVLILSSGRIVGDGGRDSFLLSQATYCPPPIFQAST